MGKKRHHYVPKAYLRFFADVSGKLRVYLKDQPTKVLHQSPDNTAFQRFYYSQPMPTGQRDDDSFEDAFSKVESKWPSLVKRMLASENINQSLEDLFTFIALQRVRVPAFRDALEKTEAEMIKATARVLADAGQLPPMPAGLENILDHVEVAMDPHRSLHAMVNVLSGLEEFFSLIGIGAVHNHTNVPFLTSDNPVIWFDSSLDESEVKPYKVRREGAITFLFPVTPRLLVFGHTSLRARFASAGFGYASETKIGWVEAVNRHVCRFAYEAVFAQATGQEEIINRYADISPVPKTETILTRTGRVLLHSMEFGARNRKPKWKGS